MAASKGRNLGFEWGGVSILGVREKGIALNGEPVDVTSDEDGGKRTLLDVSAEDQVDITVSGVTKDEILKENWFDGDRTKELEITFPNGSTLTGQFFLASYSETAPYNDAVTFEATFNSTGAFTFTPYS